MDHNGKSRSDTVDLTADSGAQHTLAVEISDALSEREKVKFTIRTRSSLPVFEQPEMSVVRQHEEFLWLHTMLEENATYAGFIIPPAPPRPDFDASREKLQRLGEQENMLTAEEFDQMKKELEAEYLATFKKTVAMHEIFLQRLAGHPVFRDDSNLHVFLTYAQDLSVRGKNKKERLAGLFSSIGKSADELLLQSTQKDIDDSFDAERAFLVKYFDQVKDATGKADRMTRSHKNLADTYFKVGSAMASMAATTECESELEQFFGKLCDTLDQARKLEGRMASDTDLKLSDVLRYYQRDSGAAKALLYRRLRALANYEATNRNLEKARLKNKDVLTAEALQKESCETFEDISDQAKRELRDFRARRVTNFKKSFSELAELELKHCRAQVSLLRDTISQLKMNVAVEDM